MLNPLQLPLTEAVYTFVDGETGQATHIAADRLRDALVRSGAIPVLCVMGGGLLAAIERGDLNQEEDHALKLADEALDTPLIVGEWGSEHIIIDGSHRLWRRYQRGDRDFNAYYVPESCWRRFIIGGMPGDGDFWREHNKTSKVR